MEDFGDTKMDSFLSDIDQISGIIKSLNSSDQSVRDCAITEADNFLKKTKKNTTVENSSAVNRTVINRSVDNSSHIPPVASDQASFLKALENDAIERAERKRIAKSEATLLKEEGNLAFKAGDYNKAVILYTQGLDKLKDFKELWTNRAQAYLKLAKYKEALVDCDWALRCDEKYIKAYVLEGKAHAGLKEFDKAIEAFNKVKEIDKSKQGMMDDFIKEVQVSKQSRMTEKDAKKLFASGARHPGTLVEVMSKVNSEGELPIYYDGGVRVLADLLINNSCKTLFRTEGGLEMYAKHPFFLRVMLTAHLESLTNEELDACCSMFALLLKAVTDNEESQRQLIGHEEFRDMVWRFLDVKVLRKKKNVKESCLCLLLGLTESEIGRKHLAANFDTSRLLETLFSLAHIGGSIAVMSFNIINNMTLENRFRRALYSSLNSVMPIFENLLSEDKHADIIPSCISIITNLCTDDAIRKILSNRASLFSACTSYLNTFPSGCLDQYPVHHKAVLAALGLIMNITLDKTDSLKQSSLSVTKSVLPFLDKQSDIQERVIGCLSHILPVSGESTDYFLADCERISTLLSLLISKQCVKYTVKTLTACTQNSKSVCKIVSQNAQAVNALKCLLAETNEALLGNVCLCLSHCIEEPSVHESMNEDDIKRLLILLREAKNNAVKQNCAILIGKMVKANGRHLESLRALDGIGILHNSTRYYKL